MPLSKTRLTTLGKFIALVLRHQPDVIGAKLDINGWLSVPVLLANTKQPMEKQELEEVVQLDDKGRYAFNEDNTQIRAVQGHSVEVDAGEVLVEVVPEYLYHGTAEFNIASIFEEGLLRQTRQFVHMSLDKETARTVGMRHSKDFEPIIVTIKASEASAAGHLFYLSENGVYLSKYVPLEYLLRP